jgi:uncharacterized membrane protein
VVVRFYVLVVLALRVLALFNVWLTARLTEKWRKLGYNTSIFLISLFTLISTVVEIVIYGENSRQFSPKWLLSAFVEKG